MLHRIPWLDWSQYVCEGPRQQLAVRATFRSEKVDRTRASWCTWLPCSQAAAEVAGRFILVAKEDPWREWRFSSEDASTGKRGAATVVSEPSESACEMLPRGR